MSIENIRDGIQTAVDHADTGAKALAGSQRARGEVISLLASLSDAMRALPLGEARQKIGAVRRDLSAGQTALGSAQEAVVATTGDKSHPQLWHAQRLWSGGATGDQSSLRQADGNYEEVDTLLDEAAVALRGAHIKIVEALERAYLANTATEAASGDITQGVAHAQTFLVEAGMWAARKG